MSRTDVLIRSTTFNTVNPTVVRAVNVALTPHEAVGGGVVSTAVMVHANLAVPAPVIHTGQTVTPVVVEPGGMFIRVPLVGTGRTISPVAVKPFTRINLPVLLRSVNTKLRQNDAEGQSAGVGLLAGQSGSGDPFDVVTLTGTATAQYSNTQKINGAQSYHVIAGAGSTAILIYQGSSDVSGAVRCYLYFTALPNTACDLMTLNNAGGMACKIQIGADNNLRIADASGGASLKIFATALTAATWYRIELSCIPGTTTSNGKITGAYYSGNSVTALDDGVWTSSTVNAGTTNITNARFGAITSAAPFDGYLDDCGFVPGSDALIGLSVPGGISISATPTRVKCLLDMRLVTGLPTGKRNASNTGLTVPVGSLTAHAGDYIVSTSGTDAAHPLIIEKLNIAGRVNFSANVHDVILRNCLIRGNSSGQVDCRAAGLLRLIIQNNEIVPDIPNKFSNGIMGHDFTALYNNIHGSTDGIGVYDTTSPSANVAVVIDGNYIHDLAFFSPDSSHSSDTPVSATHNDCIQIQGGLNIKITNNTLVGMADPTILSDDGTDAGVTIAGVRIYGDIGRSSANKNGSTPAGYNRFYSTSPKHFLSINTAIQISPASTTGRVGQVIITGNWVDGGQFTFNLDAKAYPGVFGTVSNNKFGHGCINGDKDVLWITGYTFDSITGNVFEDTGAAVVPVFN